MKNKDETNESLRHFKKIEEDIELREQLETFNVQIMDEIESKNEKSNFSEKQRKNFKALSAELKQNMNEFLSEQLQRHLRQNMADVANIKSENATLTEKLNQEKKNVARLE